MDGGRTWQSHAAAEAKNRGRSKGLMMSLLVVLGDMGEGDAWSPSLVFCPAP